MTSKKTRPTSPTDRAKAALIRKGQNPTPAAIAGHMRALAEHSARVANLHAVVEYAAARCSRTAAKYVAEHVAVLGEGPTWSEVARELEWPREVAGRIIWRLVYDGWLTYGKQARSLRPGPRYQQQPHKQCRTTVTRTVNKSRDTIGAGRKV